ncbi:hypothetical protein F443_13994 [Phytophthora nicotianae P1569]|uniref:Uncharacterized protein n=2 Tax=Phytophthora nicotianae TaxID=4792 RepID=V9ERG6_PHYNI|nr:hypothetical protein F443_13994 [Phytophthora nicotianae P1569]
MAPVMDEPGDHLTAEGHLTAIEPFQLFFKIQVQFGSSPPSGYLLVINNFYA